MNKKSSTIRSNLDNRLISLISPTTDGSKEYRVLVSDVISTKQATPYITNTMIVEGMPLGIRPTSLSVTPTESTTFVTRYTGVYDPTAGKSKEEWLYLLCRNKQQIRVERKDNLPPVKGHVFEYRHVPDVGSTLVMQTESGISVIDMDDISSFDIPKMTEDDYRKQPQKLPDRISVSIQTIRDSPNASVLVSYELIGFEVNLQTTIKHQKSIDIEHCNLSPNASIFKTLFGLARVYDAFAYPFIMVNNTTGTALDNVNMVHFPNVLANDEYAIEKTPIRYHRPYAIESESISREMAIRDPATGTSNEIESFQKTGILLGDWVPDKDETISFEQGRVSHSIGKIPLMGIQFHMACLDDNAKENPIPVFEYIRICPDFTDKVGIPPCTIAVLSETDQRIGESELDTMVQPGGKDFAIFQTSSYADIIYTTRSNYTYYTIEENAEFSNRIEYRFRVEHISPTQDFATILLYVDVGLDAVVQYNDESGASLITITPSTKYTMVNVDQVPRTSIFSPLNTLTRKGYGSKLIRYMISLVAIPREGNAEGVIIVYNKRQ